MSFVNDADFQDDFRKVGEDVTAGFEAPDEPSEPTSHASSENLGVAAKADEPDEDEDDEEEDLDDEDEDDLDDEDLEDDDEEEEDDDLDEEEDEEEDDLDDEDEEDDDEEDADKVKARLSDAEARVRAS